MAMDIVYRYHPNGAIWDELKYSLRSVCKNVKDLDNIFIISPEPPDFLITDKEISAFIPSLIHIPYTSKMYPDLLEDREHNTLHAIKIAVNDQRISNDFLFMADDYLITQPVNVTDFLNPRYEGTINNQIIKYHGSQWASLLDATYNFLAYKNYPTRNYAIHVPILYSKTAWKILFTKFDTVLQHENLYFNTYALQSYANEDFSRHITGKYLIQDIHKVFDEHHCVSYCDRALDVFLKDKIMSTFPEKSPFEI